MLTRIIIFLIGLTGLIIIGFELVGFWENTSDVHSKLEQNQKKQLELLASELESEIRHLVQIFPAFVKSQELLNKITETTLVGPYFVYSPQQYGQPIDYWDRVQILKQQVWMGNYFLPLLQGKQLDYLGIFLIDPHNNLIRHSTVPFIELEHQQVLFYSYPSKGLFHGLGRHSQLQVDKIALSNEYFDRAIYNAGEGKTLYSALGFEETPLLVSQLAPGRFTSPDKIKVLIAEKGIFLEKAITLDSLIYNWNSKTRDKTAVVTVVAQKHLNEAFLVSIREKFGSDALALGSESIPVISTLNNLKQPLGKTQGKVRINSTLYHYQTRAFHNEWLDHEIRLAVLTNESQIEASPVTTYKTITITTIITILLGLMAWFYFKATVSDTADKEGPSSTKVARSNGLEGESVRKSDNPTRERFLLIEDKGKSQTIPLAAISHIRVTDHYCTIFYLQENQWSSWMIMERLKTFEKRYQQFLIKINRSTLINPDRIEKIQLLQRKLTMQGEPDFLLTISQSSLEAIKSATAAQTGR